MDPWWLDGMYTLLSWYGMMSHIYRTKGVIYTVGSLDAYYVNNPHLDFMKYEFT